MTHRTGLTCLLALGLASACSSSSSPDEGRADEGALSISPPPTAPPPSQTLPPPPPPTYVGDSSSVAIIEADADTFWNQWFANADDVARLQHDFRDIGNSDFFYDQQRIDALIKMYDLLLPIDRVRALKFLERLRAISNVLLANRDDHRGAPVDPFRGRVMQAWGSYTADRDGKWNTDPVTSGNYIYAMAAYARRVADNPTLFCQDHLADAVRFTTAAFETYMAFHDELHFPAGSSQAWYDEPLAYANLACDSGGLCDGYRDRAGQPIAFNENLSMMRAMAEAAIAANSTLYRTSLDGAGGDVLSTARMFYLTSEAPVVIARNVQWFHDNLTRYFWSNGAAYYDWKAQPGNRDPQDTPHAQYELGSLLAVFELKPRLDAILAANGHSERVVLDPTILSGFSNTFLWRVWTYDYSDPTGLYHNILAGDVESGDPKTPTDNRNVECAGWTTLAQIDYWLWIRCRDATFKPNGKGGNYLRVDNHASLLRYRRGPTSNPAQPPPPTIPVACGPTQTAP